MLECRYFLLNLTWCDDYDHGDDYNKNKSPIFLHKTIIKNVALIMKKK